VVRIRSRRSSRFLILVSAIETAIGLEAFTSSSLVLMRRSVRMVTMSDMFSPLLTS